MIEARAIVATMKNLSIAFVATLSLLAFAGCKKKGGGDCDSTVNSAVDRMMEQQMKEGMKEGGDKMTPEMKKMAEDMANQMKPKMKAAMSKSCKDDKWSGEALKCMDDAKTMDDMEKCEAKLTPEQKKNSDKAMSEAMGMGGGAAEKPAGGEGGSAAAAGGSAAPAAGGGGDLPAECNDYKAAIDKLSSCDKMPQQARDALKNAYEQASAGWANLPAEAKANLATACKAGADAVTQSAKQVCGW
jgi:hypothetical protein